MPGGAPRRSTRKRHFSVSDTVLRHLDRKKRFSLGGGADADDDEDQSAEAEIAANLWKHHRLLMPNSVFKARRETVRGGRERRALRWAGP